MKGLLLKLSLLFSILILNAFGSPTSDEGQNWALLVAGSNNWFNYRHQADVCHSYQIMKDHGIKPENIIVMMYDDIAYNPLNPFPGNIYNQPNGPNVYEGVPKDYNKENNNPKVFLDVLQGKDPGVGSGKVIKSGPNDKIFVYFTDHGAPGLVGFGPDVLYSYQLIKALNNMYKNKKYSQMVIYIEACESGSMFANLKNNINVFATTASNSTVSSYACYWDDKIVNMLGDVYSIKWMQDSDKTSLRNETLEVQYERVKKETTTSPVCKFGDESIPIHSPLSAFQGSGNSKYKAPPVPKGCHSPSDFIKSEEVPLNIVENRGDPFEINLFHSKRRFFNATFQRIFEEFSDKLSLDEVIQNRESYELDENSKGGECYFKLVDAFHNKCFNIAQNEYALRFMFAFIPLCQTQAHQSDLIIQSMEKHCNFDSTIYGRIF